MNIYLICYSVFLGIAALVILALHIRSLKFFRSLFLHMFLGLAALTVVNLTKRFTGIGVPVNTYTIIGSCVFGIPEVCGMLIMNLLF